MKLKHLTKLPNLLGLALASTLLTACASSFVMEVTTESPGAIGKVYIIIDETATGGEWKNMVLGADAGLSECSAFLELELRANKWEQLDTSGYIGFEPLEGKPGTFPMRIKIDQAILDNNPEDGLAVVVLNDDGDFFGKHWKSTTMSEGDGLTIEITAGKVEDITATE